MNLFIHGIDGNIQLGNSYFDDKHALVKSDFVLANPPFNDGSKGENGWGADRIPDNDPRLMVDSRRMPLAARNANAMWILHFLSHLREGGAAGFVMATGELSNTETARFEVRKTLIEHGYVDCIVQLTGQLFANTQIPCSLWFLSKSRDGSRGFRKRQREILFIDGRKLGSLIPGSRKQKQLSDDEIEKIASVYRAYRRERSPDAVSGLCGIATIEEVRSHGYVLTPARYVGSEDGEDDDELFEQKFQRLAKLLEGQFHRSTQLESAIRESLRRIEYDR